MVLFPALGCLDSKAPPAEVQGLLPPLLLVAAVLLMLSRKASKLTPPVDEPFSLGLPKPDESKLAKSMERIGMIKCFD